MRSFPNFVMRHWWRAVPWIALIIGFAKPIMAGEAYYTAVEAANAKAKTYAGTWHVVKITKTKPEKDLPDYVEATATLVRPGSSEWVLRTDCTLTGFNDSVARLKKGATVQVTYLSQSFRDEYQLSLTASTHLDYRECLLIEVVS